MKKIKKKKNEIVCQVKAREMPKKCVVYFGVIDKMRHTHFYKKVLKINIFNELSIKNVIIKYITEYNEFIVNSINNGSLITLEDLQFSIYETAKFHISNMFSNNAVVYDTKVGNVADRNLSLVFDGYSYTFSVINQH